MSHPPGISGPGKKRRDSYQIAPFLHVLGDDALKVYNGFQFDTTEENRTVAEIIQKCDGFAVGEVNETYERFVFNSKPREKVRALKIFSEP